MAQNLELFAASSQLPTGWEAALAEHGWTYLTSNEAYVFLEKPGYCLRIYALENRLYASVMPERFRLDGSGESYSKEEMAPAIRGKHARQRAREMAAFLWTEHESYLRQLGIELAGVGVRQFKGTGKGGYIMPKPYFRADLAELLRAAQPPMESK